MQHVFHPCDAVHMLLTLANAMLLPLCHDSLLSMLHCVLAWLPVTVAVIVAIVITLRNR